MNIKTVQNIKISFVQKLWVNMLISWVIRWVKSWMPHQSSFRNLSHRAWALWDLSNHDAFWIIPYPDSQKRITVSLQSISTIPFKVKDGLCQDSAIGTAWIHLQNAMHCRYICTFQGIWNLPNEHPGTAFMCTADMFLNISNREIQRTGMFISSNISQVHLVICTNDLHNRHLGRKLSLRIPPTVTCILLGVYSAILWVREAHWFTI
jgi:hypothetical protein